MKKLILALLLLMVQATALAESVVEVISVYYRPASEIEPLLLPLLEGSDHIVANGDSLIVKTSPERLQTISNLIRKLDSPLNSLLITVIQSDSLTADQLNAGIGFDVYGGGNPNQFGGSVYGQGAIVNSTRNNRNTQTIRTTDGATAHIKVGAVYPLTNYQVYPGAYGYPNMSSSTQLVEATTGFAVTPRLVGQQVVMAVSPWSDRFNNQGQLQTQAAETSIRANIGEWVDLGGVDESGQSNSNGMFSYTRQTRQNNLHILVKVDVVN